MLLFLTHFLYYKGYQSIILNFTIKLYIIFSYLSY